MPFGPLRKSNIFTSSSFSWLQAFILFHQRIHLSHLWNLHQHLDCFFCSHSFSFLPLNQHTVIAFLLRSCSLAVLQCCFSCRQLRQCPRLDLPMHLFLMGDVTNFLDCLEAHGTVVSIILHVLPASVLHCHLEHVRHLVAGVSSIFHCIA